VLADGVGEIVGSAASLEEGDFGSSELFGCSLSALCDSVEPLSVFAEELAVDFSLFAVRDVACAEDLELVFAPLCDLDPAELFVLALLDVPDFVWVVALASESFEVV
jgi:hypothetical protein